MSDEHKRRCLTRPEFFRAAEALKRYGPEFVRDRPTFTRAAQILGEKLGLHVPRTTLMEIMEVVGVKWEPKDYERSNNPKKIKELTRDVDLLAGQIDSLAARIGALERTVTRLLLDLGQKPEAPPHPCPAPGTLGPR